MTRIVFYYYNVGNTIYTTHLASFMLEDYFSVYLKSLISIKYKVV